eukprot:scaffold2744_cov136-Cylindrotheca_fusiformis.AAC.4
MTRNDNNEEKEGFFKHMMRSTRNLCCRCCGCMHTTEEKAMIKRKEHKIAARKRKFGTEYIDMVRNNASEADLKLKLVECLNDIDKLVGQIHDIENDIERVKRDTEGKMRYKPGKKNPKSEQPQIMHHQEK